MKALPRRAKPEKPESLVSIGQGRTVMTRAGTFSWQEFDRLPKPLRQLLTISWVDTASSGLMESYQNLRSHGYSEQEIVNRVAKRLEASDRLVAARAGGLFLADQSWP